MEISIRRHKESVILDLRGNFDVNASNFIETIGDLLEQGVKKLVCNLENVNMVDYMGLSCLAIAYRNASNHKACLKFYNVPTHVRNIFSLLMLDDVFDVYRSEAEALDSLEREDIFAAIERKKLRRRFKRLPLSLRIEFKPKFSSSSEVFEGKILNLSAIGILIYTKNIFNLNDILCLRLLLGSEQEVIEVDSRVVWIADNKLQPQLSPGMGVEFYKMSNRLQKRIVQFVDKNLSRQSPSDH